MCGNTIVIKHASNVPLAAQTMEQIFIEAGAPEGIYNNLYVPGSKISQYINNPLIKGATLTGSEAAGIDLAEIAGKNIIKSTLELGGSDPFIVMPDSDIDKAVNCAVFGRLWNAGQVCVSPKRIIIPESIAEDFISKAVTLMESIKIGDPTDPQTQLGPLSSEAALEQVLQQVETAVKQGAKLLMGGKRIITPGAFMSPAIITDITKDMDIYSHEIFGPVMMIYVVKDIDEAIAIANDSNYGLGGTVFGEDNDAAVDVARKIETGMVYINHVTGIAAQLPFGGTKRSGYGREQSVDGMYEFVNKKLIRVTTPEADY